MSFQVENVEHPNKPSNTVIFSHMEAKSNLVLCLERFKLHISQFSKVHWEGRIFRMFLFCDYAFLCNMFRLSGARVSHPCLWCNITSDMLCVPRFIRMNMFQLRSLESLEYNLNVFHNKYNSNLKKAKFACNVVDDIFFKVPLEQVCVPGLHITLGVVVKFIKCFEQFCKSIDFKIAGQVAMNNNEISQDDLKSYFENAQQINSSNMLIIELENRRNLI